MRIFLLAVLAGLNLGFLLAPIDGTAPWVTERPVTEAEDAAASHAAGYRESYRVVPGDRVAQNYVGITQAPVMTVTVVGSGGTVTSSPAGISCSAGSTCAYAFTSGTSVTLTSTAVASNASSSVHGQGNEAFGNWGGSACPATAGSSACAYTFDISHNTATLTFTAKDSDVWWVNPSTGSDTLNDGRGAATPFLTIRKCNTSMAAGDTCYLADGTYSASVSQCIGCFNGSGNSATSDVPNGTSLKSTRYLAQNIGGAIIDGDYVRTPVYVFQRSYIELGGIVALHGLGGPVVFDGSSLGTGANLTLNMSGGGVASLNIVAGGSSYSTTSSNLVTFYGLDCTTYPQFTFTTSGGAINATAQVRAGTGCTEKVTGSAGASVNMRNGTIYVHDVGAGQAASSNVNNVGIYCNGCANSLFQDNYVWGYGIRYSVNFFSGAWNVMRRNIARYDGANAGQNNPNACIAIYSEDYTIAENNVCVDFASLNGDSSDNNALYMTSSSALSNYPYGMGTGAFYGNVAVNISGAGPGAGSLTIDNLKAMSSTPAGGVQAVVTLKDNVLLGNGSTTSNTSIYMGGDGLAATNGAHHSFVIDHNSAIDKYNPGFAVLIRVLDSTWVSKTLTNNIFISPTYTTANCARLDTTMTVVSNNLWNDCLNAEYGVLPGTPVHANPFNQTLKYPLRCETSAPCKSAGTSSSDIGATVVKRYVNGVLTGTDLWPLPNEVLAKTWLCRADDAATATVTPDLLTIGKIYVITTAGNTTWTGLGAAANTVGTHFTAKGTVGGTTGVAHAETFTRGHGVGGWCATSQTLTQNVWERFGSTSLY